MSDVWLYVPMFVLGFVGLFMLLMISQRHRNKFHLKLPRHIHKKLAIVVLFLSVLPAFLMSQWVYFLMAWFLWLSLAAGMIYVGLMIYEKYM